MSELVPPSGRVHWLGTGLSTGAGLPLLRDATDRLTVWGRTATRVRAALGHLDLDGVVVRGLDSGELPASLERGDVVVSMLPAAEHPGLLRSCVERGAHFACSSYLSDELSALVPRAAAAGLVVQTEAGLDPGIDHLLAHRLVDRARTEVGARTPARVEFTSYCGGVPAVANDFRYRFSWAPRSVLTALCSPARYVEDGAVREVAHPWTATTTRDIAGEVFEVYPNRDSVPFVAQYGIPPAWEVGAFVRGTARLSGWLTAWSEVFPVLRAGDPAGIDALAHELAARHPMTAEDRDRVVLAVALTVHGDGGSWSGEYVLDLAGDDGGSAMARTVSVTLARGVLDIVEGRSVPGLARAAESPEAVTRWLDFLAGHGISPRARWS